MRFLCLWQKAFKNIIHLIDTITSFHIYQH
jgi:hypothetical protein